MPEKYQQFLDDCISHFNETGDREMSFRRDKNEDNWTDIRDCVDYLSSSGYLKIIANAIGLIEIQLTPKALG